MHGVTLNGTYGVTCGVNCHVTFVNSITGSCSHIGKYFQTYFLPVIGLVDLDQLKPADLVVSLVTLS